MGHSSIPSLNKVGQSNYWNFMWDDKHEYKKSLNESLFLQEYVHSFFEHFSLKKFTNKLYNHNFILKNLKIYNIFLKKKYDYKELKQYIRTVDSDRYFFSKIWVMKYQKKIVIFFFVYISFLSQKKKKNKKNKTIYKNVILKNYILASVKSKYNLNNSVNLYKNINEF